MDSLSNRYCSSLVILQLAFDAALPSPVCQATLSTPKAGMLLFANPVHKDPYTYRSCDFLK